MATFIKYTIPTLLLSAFYYPKVARKYKLTSGA